MPAVTRSGHANGPWSTAEAARLCGACRERLSDEVFDLMLNNIQQYYATEALFTREEAEISAQCHLCLLLRPFVSGTSSSAVKNRALSFQMLMMGNPKQFKTKTYPVTIASRDSLTGYSERMWMEVKEKHSSPPDQLSSPSQAYLEPTTPRAQSHRQIKTRLDIDILQSWLKEWRASTHFSASGSTTNDAAFWTQGLRLIDCLESRLHTVTIPTDFIALSYVWGEQDPMWLTTTKQNLPALQQKHALSQPLIGGKLIPRTVQDSILLTRMLGLRYLWVDALCITQDNDAESKALIDNMDKVYAAAFTTLVVTSGKTADDPIPGISSIRTSSTGVTAKLDTEKHHILFGPDYHSDPSVYFANCVWQTRGWTLQEGLLARSCLFLTRQQAVFLSRLGWRSEGSTNLQAYDSQGGSTAFIRPLQYPNRGGDHPAQTYMRMVELYTARTLGRPADVLRAFTGIYNQLSPSGQGLAIEQTQAILPTALPHALLWLPFKLDKQRRTQQLDPTDRNPHLSSWAWAYWIGTVKFIDHSPDLISLADKFTYGPATVNSATATATCSIPEALQNVANHFQHFPAEWLDQNPRISDTQTQLREGQISFKAPCIACSKDLTALLPPYSVAYPRKFQDSILTDYTIVDSPLGYLAFDDEVRLDSAELVVLACNPRSVIGDNVCLLGLITCRDGGGIARRYGTFQIFVDTLAWRDFIGSGEVECRYGWVVLQ